MTTYIDLPDTQTGDILSASRLNALARNIDVATGLDDMKVWPVESGADVANCGIYSRASDARFGGNQAVYYVAHNGDRMAFYHVLTGSGGSAYINYGTYYLGSFLNSTTYNNIVLPSLPRYTIVPVSVVSEQQANNLFVRTLYTYQSNALPIGTMPTFTNGTQSSAAHFNTIRDGTKRAVTLLNQPIVGMYGINQYGDNAQLAYERFGYYGYIRHKHNQLYFERTAWVDGLSPGDEMALYYNNNPVWRWQPYASGVYSGSGIDVFNLAPYSLTVGQWYPIEFRMTFAGNVGQRATIWALYEQPATPGTSHSPITRWEHGDLAAGSDGTSPILYEMNRSLGEIGAPYWTNPACRAGQQWIPNQSGVCNPSSPIVDEFSSIRVHKWLAYENIEKLDGTRAPVILQYRTNPYAPFAAETLPAVNVPSYYDLDSSPVRPGMYFRLIGSKFLIQTPGIAGE